MNFRKWMSNLLLITLVCALLGGCSGVDLKSSEKKAEGPNEQAVQKEGYTVDYLKISPMIEENLDQAVIDAAINVIEAFLNYETCAKIVVTGNESRFLNDMGYVINSTCPMFAAFADYNESTAYDAKKKEFVWSYFIPKEQFEEKVASFGKTVQTYLSLIDKDDSDAMKAILLYCSLVQDASYDEEILGDAYETMDKAEYRLRESPYNVLVNKKGICTNLSQALMFLYTQADLSSGTVLHQGGVGAHMWSVVKIDDQYYYCDPTWDLGDGPKTFGITSDDRSSWAGGYSKEEGRMLTTVIAQKYEINDTRFAIFREKIPAEITDMKVDKTAQTITFEGYDYEYTFYCKK